MADDDDRLEYEGDTGRRPLPPADSGFEVDDDFFESDEDSVFFETFDDVDEQYDDRPEPEDFGFDEIATDDEPLTAAERRRAERASGRGGRRRGGGIRTPRLSGKRTPRRASSGGGGAMGIDNRLLRMGLAALFVVLLIVVLALVVRDCRRDAQVDAYKQYVNGAAQVSEESARQGQVLLSVLSNRNGQGVAALQQRVGALANQAGELSTRTDSLDPPGRLSDAQSSLLLGLQYREDGLRALESNLPEIVSQGDTNQAGNLIKQSMKLFAASDVIIASSFIEPTSTALREEGIQNVAPPDEQNAAFLRGNNDRFATDQFAKTLVGPLRRQRPSSSNGSSGTGGDIHGTNLVSVTALPSGTVLQTSGTDLEPSGATSWQVVVRNGGDFLENNINVTVTLTYPDGAGPSDSQTATIETIRPGQSVSIDVEGPPQDALSFGTQGTLQVAVATVTGEENANNNSARYPVTFTLG